ncbi:FAD/NAD(P)-binding oxidoreductase [Streptomyces phaeochromogenes]|uniref:NAD(P)/FAD-dependent oxidoreductase n=1 Tax=Streptomyces phaeochromogenes TaxID=1923 RepID=A0ABZ1H4R9_STRPH|nr:FAD/NAD(P)-binding oxidoreductase [Streptomyces phaeochromogenes]WRZ27038.1 NAD(P)/FAD-dependent oxidoreductase [Streptomyces phaeochromogenes]WSD12602.1 NAD(P)/FAD-dependent oxidoreductase [Streptomyces phaeochromogenes]
MPSMPSRSSARRSARRHHRVLIVGGGTAGITVAARLRRAGVTDVAVLEPASTHWYQPLWTLVGGGQAPLDITRRPEASVMPRRVCWIRGAAASVDPEARTVTTTEHRTIGYDHLVLAPGLQLDWDAVPGLDTAVGHGAVSSNYSFEHAPYTWELIRGLRSGTAVFTQPTGPVKCGGAPQKIAYLAADHWRRQGVLDRIRVFLVLPTDSMFAVPVWRRALERVAERYGIEVRLSSEMTAVDGAARRLTVTDHSTGDEETIAFDLLHAVPPQSAPDWVKHSPLADPTSPYGYAEVDKFTLQHPRHRNVFALGDVANLPTSKTGAAVRKQAPVVVANLLAEIEADPKGEPRDLRRYDGYTSCPLVTARDRMLLAEFDYDLRPAPSIPLVDTTKERRDMWLLKRYGLPAMYWHGMLRGLA